MPDRKQFGNVVGGAFSPLQGNVDPRAVAAEQAEQSRMQQALALARLRQMGSAQQGQQDLGREALGVQRELGLGQLGVQNRGLDVQQQLGNRGFDVQQQLGQGELDVRRRGLDQQFELGQGELDVRRQLGQGELDVQREGLQSQERIAEIATQPQLLDAQRRQAEFEMQRALQAGDIARAERQAEAIRAIDQAALQPDDQRALLFDVNPFELEQREKESQSQREQQERAQSLQFMQALLQSAQESGNTEALGPILNRIGALSGVEDAGELLGRDTFRRPLAQRQQSVEEIVQTPVLQSSIQQLEQMLAEESGALARGDVPRIQERVQEIMRQAMDLGMRPEDAEFLRSLLEQRALDAFEGSRGFLDAAERFGAELFGPASTDLLREALKQPQLSGPNQFSPRVPAGMRR